MADFKLNEKIEIDASKNTVSVDTIDGARPKPGKYKFSLVVIGDNGVESAPQEIIVNVVRLAAVLAAVNASGVQLANNTARAGETFSLSAKGSEVEGGNIKGYRFSFVGQVANGRGPPDI